MKYQEIILENNKKIQIFDVNIPHALRPQSIKSPKFRLTLSLFFDT
jgi:hypothetical protein